MSSSRQSGFKANKQVAVFPVSFSFIDTLIVSLMTFGCSFIEKGKKRKAKEEDEESAAPTEEEKAGAPQEGAEESDSDSDDSSDDEK